MDQATVAGFKVGAEVARAKSAPSTEHTLAAAVNSVLTPGCPAALRIAHAKTLSHQGAPSRLGSVFGCSCSKERAVSITPVAVHNGSMVGGLAEATGRFGPARLHLTFVHTCSLLGRYLV